MRLTKSKAWNCFAGGSSAAPDKNSWTAITDKGEYHISPVSHPQNYRRHMGYSTYFVNTKGANTGGLYQNVSHSLLSLTEARLACQKHYESLPMPGELQDTPV